MNTLLFLSFLLAVPRGMASDRTLRVGTPKVSSVTDPAYTGSSITAARLTLLHRRLLKVGQSGGIKGDLAASWKISKDFSTYSMCAPRTRFRSGRELNVADIQYSLARVGKFKSQSVLSRIIQSIEPTVVQVPFPFDPNMLCFEMKLREPYPDFLYLLANPVFSIVPENADVRGLDGLGPYVSEPSTDKNGKFVTQFRRVGKVDSKIDLIQLVNVGTVQEAIDLLEKNELDLYSGMIDFQNLPAHGRNFRLEKLQCLTVTHLAFNLSNPMFEQKELRADLAKLLQHAAWAQQRPDDMSQYNPFFLPTQILPYSKATRDEPVFSMVEFSRKWGAFLHNKRFRIVGWSNELNARVVDHLRAEFSSLGMSFEYSPSGSAESYEQSGDYEMMFTNQVPEFEKPESFFDIFYYPTLNNALAQSLLQPYQDLLQTMRVIPDSLQRRQAYIKFFEQLDAEKIIVPLYRTTLPVLTANSLKLPDSKFRFLFDLSKIEKKSPNSKDEQ